MIHATALESQQSTHGWGIALLIAIATFAFIAPTLTQLEFSSGSENLNVGTVIEMKRGGPWLVPKLNGKPRTTKPPLTAWVSALLIPSESVEALSTSDQSKRDQAYTHLAWQIRWPALLLSCLMLLATFDLGRTIADARAGWIASAVCASTLMFLHFSRSATTDVQLALWVTVANALLARAVILRQVNVGYVGAGIALGLGLMSKGPVCLVQSVVPVLVWCIWTALRHGGPSRASVTTSNDRDDPLLSSPSPRRDWLPICLGLATMLLICVPWPLFVYIRNPNILTFWISEITREGATNLQPDPFYSYMSFFGRMMPWTIFFIAGALMAVGLDGRRDPRRMLAVLMTFLPIVIMSFFKDKNDRYLLPMIAPAAVLCALAVGEQFKARLSRVRADDVVRHLHFGALTFLAIGFPIAGAVRQTGLTRMDDSAWFSPAQAASLAIGGAVLCTVGWWGSLRRPALVVVTSFIAMMVLQIAFIRAYRQTYDGRSEMKLLADAVWQTVPNAVVCTAPARPPAKAQPADLPIYLNRVCPPVVVDGKADKPLVVIYLQRRGNPPEPLPVAPDTFQPLTEVRWRKHTWHAFYRPPLAPGSETSASPTSDVVGADPRR